MHNKTCITFALVLISFKLFVSQRHSFLSRDSINIITLNLVFQLCMSLLTQWMHVPVPAAMRLQ